RLEGSSGGLRRLEDSWNIEEHFPDSGVQRDSSQSPELGGIASDPTSLEEIVESDSERGENHWQLVVKCSKRDNGMSFLMLFDSLHMGEPTRIKNELKNFLKIAYEGKEMRAVADELKVIDLHVSKVPQQKGSTECGLMVLYFIFRFILAAPASFGTNDYPSFRKFDVPISLRDFVMKDLDQKWRSWKYNLRMKFFTPYQKVQQHFACSDTRVVEDQWKNLVQIWSSEEFKFLKTGATLDLGDLFIRTRMKKAGGPVNEESAAMIDKIRDIKLTQQSSTSSLIVSVGDAYEQVMGHDRTGRVRDIGTGPTVKSLWGSRSEQKLRQDNESLKQQIDALEERMKKN
ncbi:hypothetical protein Taro_033062, partial [Colocasia esculenta]|nr:hypothetical protein [Colocasia esculenta]